MIIVQKILTVDDNDDWPSSSRMITHDWNNFLLGRPSDCGGELLARLRPCCDRA